MLFLSLLKPLKEKIKNIMAQNFQKGLINPCKIFPYFVEQPCLCIILSPKLIKWFLNILLMLF